MNLLTVQNVSLNDFIFTENFKALCKFILSRLHVIINLELAQLLLFGEMALNLFSLYYLKIVSKSMIEHLPPFYEGPKVQQV